MLFSFGKVVLVFGWFLIVMGIAYLALGGRGAMAQIPGSLLPMVRGLIAIVVGSAIVVWVKRYGTS
jgi:hypothetical protein